MNDFSLYWLNFLGYINIAFGIFFLLLPILFIELSKPRDLTKGGINTILGIYILIQKNYITEPILFILTLNIFLFGFFLVEIFSFRWNQLTNDEKNKLKTISEFGKRFLIFIEAFNLGLRKIYQKINKLNFFSNKSPKKKWVRLDKEEEKKNKIQSISNSQDKPKNSTKLAQEDIILNDKNLIKESQTDIK